MAIDYDTANTGIFYRLGRLVEAIDAHEAPATTDLPAELKQLADPFEAADRTDQIDALYAGYLGLADRESEVRRGLAAFGDRVLTDRAEVLDELSVATSDPQAVLRALHRRMLADSEAIERSVVTLGTVTASALNAGDGEVFVTKVLDGVSKPLLDGEADRLYAGVDSELCVPSETMALTFDEEAGEFLWSGATAGEPFDWRGDGSGEGPNVPLAENANVVSNAFETFTDDVPDGWEVTDGTAGTHVFEATAAADVFRGTSALKLTGDGSAAIIQIAQEVSADSLVPRQRCLLSFHMRASGTAASGKLAVGLGGVNPEGVFLGAPVQIQVTGTGFPTGWTRYTAWVRVPAPVPENPRIFVKASDTLTSGVSVYVDSVAMTPAVYHGGVGAAAVGGAGAFAGGDQFTWTVANAEGVFQRHMRRWYRVQLPSSASPTISDTLAGG